LLLFDVDMTLLYSDGAGMAAMSAAARRLFGDDFSWEGADAAGALDPALLSEALAVNHLPDGPDQHKRFHDAYIRQLPVEIAARRERITAKPGVLALLKQLRQRASEQRDVVLGLLTGNYGRAAAIKLAAVGIDVDWFELQAFGDHAADRPALVKVAMDRYEQHHGQTISPHDVIIIGDTLRDIAAAKAHRCRCLAVATGRFTTDQLREAGADVVVEDLADPQPLLAMIDQKASDATASEPPS